MFIVFWLILFLFLLPISFIKVRNSKEKYIFIYKWAFFCGAFVWEDLLIFSIFNILLALITLYVNDYRIFILTALSFGVIRTSGETLYYFLQQFIRPNFPPHDIHNHFQAFRHIFGDISDQKYFIMAQVFLQVLLVAFLSTLILLILNWTSFPLQVIY